MVKRAKTTVRRARVFSSEVGTGSRKENASNQKNRARLRSNQKQTLSSAAKKSVPAISKAVASELATLLDYVRFAVSRFVEAKLVFAHGTTDPVVEAIFVVCETLHLHPDQFESFATARVTKNEGRRILSLIDERVRTRKPSAYLLKKIYMRGLPFYVDERVIVPRSFIGELLESHFSGDDSSLIDDPDAVAQVLDLCTGSGCLAILAAAHFSNAQVDAVDISKDALAVAQRNVADHGLQRTVTLYRGDLFAGLPGDARYDLIITNPPYVDAEGMASLPRECRHEPKIAFDGGEDGLDIVRKILADAGRHLTDDGGLLCEVGRGREVIEAAFPQLPFLWLDSEDSEAEVFWLPAGALTRNNKKRRVHSVFEPARAFSSEACPRALDPWVDTGSREENASNQNIRARLRFNQKRTRSRPEGSMLKQ
jgi:ribosomal protein L3 glutamine methyltransferase